MFRGIAQISLDAKGRFAMPARYRDRIAREYDGHLVATIDLQQPCISIYMPPDWSRIEDQFASLPRFDAAAQQVRRMLLGHAEDLSFDSAGRVLLPASLRDHASLNRKVALVGQGNYLELWSEEAWSAMKAESMKSAAEAIAASSHLQSLVF